MKKTLFVTALAAAAAMSAPALAQSAGNTLAYNLDADVGAVCGVYATGGQSVAIAFGDLAVLTSTQSAVRNTDVVYRCNTTTGFSREVTSANGGVLVRQGENTLGSDRISYRFSELSTTRELVTRSQPLSSRVATQHAGSQAFLTGVTSTQSFEVSGVARTYSGLPNGAPGTTVFAGDYTDTVTISINAR